MVLCFGIQFVKGVDPVSLQEVNQEDDAAAGPGDGIGPGDGFQPVEVGNRKGDVADPEEAPAAQHGKHGNRGFACAPENARDTVGKGQNRLTVRMCRVPKATTEGVSLKIAMNEGPKV